MRLEMSHDVVALLREAWRVLAAGGRLLAVVPNRRGLWARMDTTPFGHGRPYSRSQITQLLRETWFTPTGWGEALYVPPIARSWFLRSAGAWERTGARLVGAVRRACISSRRRNRSTARSRRAASGGTWCRELEPVLAPSPGGAARPGRNYSPAGRPGGDGSSETSPPSYCEAPG